MVASVQLLHPRPWAKLLKKKLSEKDKRRVKKNTEKNPLTRKYKNWKGELKVPAPQRDNWNLSLLAACWSSGVVQRR